MSHAILGWGYDIGVAIYWIASTLASGHALLKKRDPRAAFGWISVCWLLPLVGTLLYLLFGINRVENRGLKLRGLSEARTENVPTHDQSLPLTQLQRLGGAVSGMPLVVGNDIRPLLESDQAYRLMLEAINAATKHVWMASYILDVSGWCRRFVEALLAAEDRGVQVRVLVDGFGEYYSFPRPVSFLRRRGIRAGRFLPPRLFPLSLSVNLRNHRKLLIVDGGIAFTGGMNVSNRYLKHDRRRFMRDLHFRITGPVVAQLAAAFRRDWYFATSEKLSPGAAPVASGGARCRVISDGPDEDIDKLLLLLVSAIAAANERVSIMTPYFLPPRELSTTLQAAVIRGVEVDVILPVRSNLFFVDWASRHDMSYLIDHGVRIWLSPPPFVHSKLLLVDGIYALLGSGNLDPRSLRLNFEIGVEVFDRPLCARLARLFQATRESAHLMDAQRLRSLPLPVRIRNGVCWLFSPYL